jgi:hypothetical protein
VAGHKGGRATHAKRRQGGDEQGAGPESSGEAVASSETDDAPEKETDQS